MTATHAPARPAPAHPAPARPAPCRAPVATVHHRAVFTWVAVYAAIIVVQSALGPVTASLPAPVRTLILTAIVVPMVVYGLVPALLRLHAATVRRRRR